jgi:ADP-heptose:LPS heptosyltransferase
MRQWPADHFITLIDLLTDALDCRIVLVGGVEDGALATHISGKVRNSARVTCAAGSVTLERLPALLAGCDLFIGNNSGPQHLAAALNVPTIGIHSGVVATREWAPNGSSAVAIGRATICAPCYIAKPEDCPRALACLTDLSPESVLRLARTMLAPAAARRAGSGAERG